MNSRVGLSLAPFSQPYLGNGLLSHVRALPTVLLLPTAIVVISGSIIGSFVLSKFGKCRPVH